MEALTCVCLFLHHYVWVAFNKIGGYGNLERVYSIAVPKKIIPNSTCHLPRADAMHLFRDAVTGDLPWPGMTLGLTILATWYWCTDQVNLHYSKLAKMCFHQIKWHLWGHSVLKVRSLDFFFSSWGQERRNKRHLDQTSSKWNKKKLHVWLGTSDFLKTAKMVNSKSRTPYLFIYIKKLFCSQWHFHFLVDIMIKIWL